MSLPPRAPKFEWNLNTLVSLATLASTLIGLVYIWADKTRDIDELQEWRISHEQYHKERMAELKGMESSINERLRSYEIRINDSERKIDQLTYRVTVGEQSAASISNSIKDMQSIVNKQAGDLQVVREILQRMEARAGKISLSPEERLACPVDKPIWISEGRLAHGPDSPWRKIIHPIDCAASLEDAASRGFRAANGNKIPSGLIPVTGRTERP